MSSSRLTIQETLIRAEKARALEASFQTLHRVPQIQAFFPGLQLGSYFENPHPLNSNVYENPPQRIRNGPPRIAVLQHHDMLDPILSWQHSLYNGGIAPLANLNDPNSTSKRICLINAAHDERAGGDWVSSATCQEDSICRRSTLYHALTHPAPGEIKRDFYPLETGGIYSPNVVVHKDGPSGLFRNYENPGDCTIISVVSVPPERAPMLGGDGCYLFDMERDLQRSKMATALRIAAVHKHRNVAIGMFGSVNREVPEYSTRKANRGGGVHGQGPLHDERRDINPIREVAALWSGLLENDRGEFAGLFDNVVFVVGTGIRAADDAHCLSKAFRLPAVSKLVKSWYPDQYDDLL